MPFDMHFTAKLPPLAILEKIEVLFRKKSNFVFSETSQILNVLRNPTVSIAFYGKFATIW